MPTGDPAPELDVDILNIPGSGFDQVTFAAGESTAQITVDVAGDLTEETNETFQVHVFGPDNIIADTASATILDDDSANSIYISDVQVKEGSSGSTTDAVFTVSLSTPVAAPVTVDFATADGTAAAGTDYTAVNGTLTFAPGETSQTITVPITGDGAVEPNESFFVNLSNPVNDVIADGQGEATIIDDDGALNHTGTNADEVLDGADGDDILVGGNGDDTLTGAAGDDVLTGGSGDDAIDGGAGDDILAGGSGDDTLSDAEGDDVLGGGSGNDVLEGGAGDDTLSGGSGDDQLSGGSGNDALIGGSGNDAFVFRAADGDSGHDTIRLFHADEDTLRFEDYGERLDAFSDLDTNANGELDDGDAHVSVDAGDTVIDLGGQTDGESGGILTLVGVTGLEADDMSFG
jgi:Ca2+-binding RTX toxin-like protein